MPMVKSSRITPISAAAFTSAGSDDQAERVRTDHDPREQEADDRDQADAVADVGDGRRRDDQRDRLDQERRGDGGGEHA